MAFWLMKSEPASYGWDDLVRDKGTEIDPAHNPVVRFFQRFVPLTERFGFVQEFNEAMVAGRVDPAVRAFVVTGEEGILAIEGDGADQVFDPVGVDLHAAVFEENFERLPLREGIVGGSA